MKKVYLKVSCFKSNRRGVLSLVNIESGGSDGE